MDGKIIWVFGASAAGKETFIKILEKDRPKKLLKRLDLEEKKLVVCRESVNYIAQEEGDSLGDKREEIINKVLELAGEKDSAILIKGQDLDLESHRLEKLKELLPSWEHIIVYLYTDFNLLYQRCRKKPWWKKEWKKEGYMKWAKYQVDLLSKLKNFKIIALDSGDSKDYNEKEFPPVF